MDQLAFVEVFGFIEQAYGKYAPIRKDRIRKVVMHLTKEQFANICFGFVDSDKKPGVQDFAIKARAITGQSQMNPEVDIGTCVKCYETGFLFTKCKETGYSPILVKCPCGRSQDTWIAEAVKAEPYVEEIDFDISIFRSTGSDTEQIGAKAQDWLGVISTSRSYWNQKREEYLQGR